MRKIGKNRYGFTLAELLIVAAVIVVLVCISVPVYIGQMRKVNKAVDEANVRSAKAAAVYTQILSPVTYPLPISFYYDADAGTVSLNNTISGYGQSDTAVDNAAGIPKENGEAKIICITIASDGSTSASWIKSSAQIIGGVSVSLDSDIETAQYTEGDRVYLFQARKIYLVGGDYYVMNSTGWSSTSGTRITGTYSEWFKANVSGSASKIDMSKIVDANTVSSSQQYKAGTIYQYSGTLYVCNQTTYSSIKKNASCFTVLGSAG